MHREFPASPASRTSSSGFSLPEVAMAIGIIAVAFVALIGLLPVGLNTYRAAMDESNQTWILQSMNSMIQTTDFAHINELDHEFSGEIYYYDEGAKLTDTKTQPGTPEAQNARIYAVKLLTDKAYRPDERNLETRDQLMTHSARVIAVMAPYLNPKAMEQFETVDDAKSLLDLPAGSTLRTKVFYVSRMDSQDLTVPPEQP